MDNKESNNSFKFSLYQENVLLCESIFSADQFSPFTRYSIDIRDILPRIITKFQKILSKHKYETVVDVGRKDLGESDAENCIYDLYEYYDDMISKYPQKYRKEMSYNPQSITHQIENKVIRGVECKIGLYINDNPIVERLFYVDGFNPISRWSVDLTNTFMEILDTIIDKIKKNDLKNIWDDYDLINNYGLSINQIREFSPYRREELLKKLENR